ncbi:MAG: outer membrane beta-barrel protein, partial [Myxococcota bacterium]
MFEEIVSLDRGAPGNEQQGKGEIAMRSTLKSTILGAAAAGLLFAPLASASQVEDQLQSMQDRMSQMEEQLQATHDDLRAANERADHQATVIRDAGLEDERSATSALSSFLSDTEFYGWVNTSYTLNTHSKGSSAGINGQNNGAAVSSVAPMHGDNMTFQVNQAWIGMDNAATADSRAGFHMDLLFGSDANSFGGFGCDGATGNGSTNSVCVFTANVSYLAPIGPNGVEITMGKMATLLGA